MNNDMIKMLSSLKDEFSGFLPKNLGTSFSEYFDRNSIVDITRSENTVNYLIDVPGVREENMQVEIEGNMVRVRAERTGRTSRQQTESQFTIDTRECDVSSMTAMLAEGVLTISFQTRKPEAKPEIKKIPVKSMR